ncbi:MAG: MBL fold metallo-hydrolase [Candidatus Methanomethylophilaceae archaeon]|nr:MBL fold metallo-hydrolase [Candidatus Methanomethylophilaceae archaeon]
MKMKLRFLGGADNVGRMAMLMETDNKTMIFEYGMTPTKPPSYPLPSPRVDHAFLTHCHLDHCGMMPWLCGRYDNEVFTTPLTGEIGEIMMYDSLKIAKAEGYAKPFSSEDVEATVRNVVPLTFEDTIELGRIDVTLHSAGHVPGAAMFELVGDRRTLYTGDIHTLNTNLVYGAKPVKCDNLFIEGTYGNRLHKDRKQSEKDFVDKVKEVVEQGGKALIPCFAVGRTQEVMMLLKDLHYDMWVDGMGRKITSLYTEYPEYLSNLKKLKASRRSFHEVKSSSMRAKSRKGEVIVTTGGMLDGGPVLNYMRMVKDDPKSAILLTGYQAEDTNGRMLMEHGKVVIDGVEEKINCPWFKYDFSAHADQAQLVEFIRGCDPENVVIMHSEHREALRDALGGNYNVILPAVDEAFELEG